MGRIFTTQHVQQQQRPQEDAFLTSLKKDRDDLQNLLQSNEDKFHAIEPYDPYQLKLRQMQSQSCRR